MDEKREIGKKIWELFIKNYSYGKIAKELGVSKSLVSNIINYSLPATTWISENVKQIKQKHEQELQEKNEQIKKLKDECKDLEYESYNIFIISLITITVYVIVTAITLCFIKINFYYNFWYTLGFIVYSAIFLIIIFFAVAYARENEWI